MIKIENNNVLAHTIEAKRNIEFPRVNVQSRKCTGSASKTIAVPRPAPD